MSHKPKVSEQYLYAKLTWPELRQAAQMNKVVVLPVGSTEQHGRHLPIDVDNFLCTNLALTAAQRAPDKMLVAPTIPYGFNVHAFDFPGTMHVPRDPFVDYVVDVCKSFSYHGFKRIILYDGHGSNMPPLNLAARRIALETDAMCACLIWVSLLAVDPNHMQSWRESRIPGGCAHACELETSAYLHFGADKVQMDKAEDNIAWYNYADQSKFGAVDLLAGGSSALKVVEWTSTYTPQGVMGQATLATPQKGEIIVEEAVSRLIQFVDVFQNWPEPERRDHHLKPPTSPLSTG
ncbi:MAG: creatininase family protein [Anaerolineae bacterium]